MALITAPIAALRSEVFVAFPEARYVGAYLRRRIAGTTSWSQHSWGNALDVGVPLRDSGPRVDWGGAARTVGWGYDLAYGDQIRAWVANNASRLSLGTVLWRIARHYDHLHVEGLPKHYGVPPYPTAAPVAPPPPSTQEVPVAALPLLRAGARGGPVAICQGLLLAHGGGPEGLINASGHPDGLFGSGTASEVRRFQVNHGLVDDGIVGLRTWSALLGLS